MRRTISFTFIIIVTICSLMSIIALMPATEAYEVLLRNWGGAVNAYCCVWQEDVNRNFVTFIPPNLQPEGKQYYCFPSCATFDGMRNVGADLRNGILTYHTIDNTTTYWVNLGAEHLDGYGYHETYQGGYNKDTCFHVAGGMHGAYLGEAPYEECERIRDSNPNP